MRVFGRRGSGLVPAGILQTHLSDDKAVAKMGHPVYGARAGAVQVGTARGG